MTSEVPAYWASVRAQLKWGGLVEFHQECGAVALNKMLKYKMAKCAQVEHIVL